MTYHTVYNPYLELASLEKKYSLDDIGEEFIGSFVHPADQKNLNDFIRYCVERFAQEGVKQCECYARVRKGEGWQKFRIEMVRVERGEDAGSNALMFWRPQEEAEKADDNSMYAAGRRMLEGVAGVFIRCRNDEYGTVLEGSDGIAAVTGFTRDEINGFYDSKLVDMMYAEDREDFLTETGMQRPTDSMITLQYRLHGKSGSAVWILDKRRFVISEDKGEYYDCFLTDITHEKRLQEKINLLNEKHQIFKRQTNNVIFEWDVDTDTIEFSDEWKKNYGYDLVIRDAGMHIMNCSKIHPDDRRNMESKIAAVLDNTRDEILRFRLWRRDGRFAWCEARGTCQRDLDGNALKIVGVIIDLDDKKEQK